MYRPPGGAAGRFNVSLKLWLHKSGDSGAGQRGFLLLVLLMLTVLLAL
jgi:hypothetical protein